MEAFHQEVDSSATFPPLTVQGNDLQVDINCTLYRQLCVIFDVLNRGYKTSSTLNQVSGLNRWLGIEATTQLMGEPFFCVCVCPYMRVNSY